MEIAHRTRSRLGKAIQPPERYIPVIEGDFTDDLSASDLSEDDSEMDEVEDSGDEFDPANPDTDSDIEVDDDDDEDEDEDEDEDDEEVEIETKEGTAAQSGKKIRKEEYHGDKAERSE
jgi:hypothetical protein